MLRHPACPGASPAIAMPIPPSRERHSSPGSPSRPGRLGRGVAGLRLGAAALGQSLARLWDGPGRITGALAGGALLALAGPAWALAGVLGGACAGRIALRHRRMTARESALAASVFGNSLPAPHRIVLTDLCGLGGTCFVCPGLGGQILVNLGRRGFDDPIGCCTPTYAAPGKLFIHELTHAWQLAHGHYFPRLLPRLLAGPRAGDAVYRPPAVLVPPWPRLTLEQQATIVDEWFHPGRLGPAAWLGLPGMSEAHPYWLYVRDVIQAASLRGRSGGGTVQCL
ncbi:hypothetical protein [Azohydromonas caseinilytica]|uniref:DUF4157 domain-containing protein n=1 Tax=Azohydromonas caseinilytica TaxID=2728836 RepID=A0A848FLX8_9BURK|nr:hypothetical protein [Azohydromonas caseinilytica]NML18791.1 hypothetical protein [Azohydromonas caseinilytica]